MAVIDHQKQAIESAHFENTELGLKAFEKWLKTHKVCFDQNTVLVIENTGIYRSGEPSPPTLGILPRRRSETKLAYKSTLVMPLISNGVLALPEAKMIK